MQLQIKAINEVAGRVLNKAIDELATKKKAASVLENALARPLIRSDIFKALQEEKAAQIFKMQLEIKSNRRIRRYLCKTTKKAIK